MAHGARAGEARARVEQTHFVLQPRHAADERTLSQRHARQSLRYREKPVAGGTLGLLAAHRVRGFISMRRKHAQSRRGGRDPVRDQCRESRAQLPHERTAQAERPEPDIPAIGGCKPVARAFEEENGPRGKGGGG